ncbi:hypothetical protein LL01C3_28700 [Escherichia coli]
MTKTVSTSKKPRKQHSPEFRSEALKLAERIGVTAAARELSLYESQLYNWRSKQQNQQTSRTYVQMKAGCIWQWSLTCGHVPLLAGQCRHA